MGKRRSDLGFGEKLAEFDPSSWTPSQASAARHRPGHATTKAAAEVAGFQSREPGQGIPRLRRRRTGRNAQFNIKTTPNAIEEFCAIADSMNWGLGETFEKAIPLLQREFGSNSDKGEK